MPILLQQVIIRDILTGEEAESSYNGLKHKIKFAIGQLLIAAEVEDIKQDCIIGYLQCTL